MPPVKKSASSKIILTEKLDDFLTEFLNGSPKNKNPTKRQANIVMAEAPNLSDTNPTGAKKNKINESIEACGESRQKTLNVMNRQLDARKQVNENMFKNLSDVIEDFEADYNALNENEQKLEPSIGGPLMKFMQQSTAAYKQKLKSFKKLHANFKKRYEDIDLEQLREIDKLGEELEEDISQLKQKLIMETKRGEWENFQKDFMKAMQNNIKPENISED